MTNKLRMSGALAQVHGECAEGCLDSSWTLDHPTVNHNHCLWRCWPPRRIELTMDLETHICRSISLKASYPLNEKNLLFSNLVASLRKLLCELTIVPHEQSQDLLSQGLWVHAFFASDSLSFDNQLTFQNPWATQTDWQFHSAPGPFQCHGNAEFTYPGQVGKWKDTILWPCWWLYAYIIHTFSIDWHWENIICLTFTCFWGFCRLNHPSSSFGAFPPTDRNRRRLLYCGHMEISIHGATKTSSFLPWKTTMAVRTSDMIFGQRPLGKRSQNYPRRKISRSIRNNAGTLMIFSYHPNGEAFSNHRYLCRGKVGIEKCIIQGPWWNK